MEISGKVYKVSDIQKITDTFSKRELVVLDDSNADYPEHIKVEAFNDNASLFDNLNQGDSVTVSINLRGRLYTNKEGKEMCFNTIVAWRVQKGEASTTNNKSISAEKVESKDLGLPF